MQEFHNAHFERAGLRPNCKAGTYAERIAATLDLPVERVAQIMASGGQDTQGFNFHVFDNMRGDHLEILRLLFHGESLTDIVLKIRRDLNPQATLHGVRQTGIKYLPAFKAAVAAGRISATPSASTVQPVGREDFSAGRKVAARRVPRPDVAEKTPCKIKLAEGSATSGRPVSHFQPPTLGHPADISATRPVNFTVRPDFSQPSAGQISRRLVDYDRLTGRPEAANDRPLSDHHGNAGRRLRGRPDLLCSFAGARRGAFPPAHPARVEAFAMEGVVIGVGVGGFGLGLATGLIVALWVALRTPKPFGGRG